MAVQTKGFCKYCGKEYTRSGMLRHLEACKSRKIKLESETKKRRCRYFQIVITGKYVRDYWLIVEASEDTTLKELDQFIRDIWVECCGHLSAFTIRGIEYESCPDAGMFWGTPSKNMNYRLKDVVGVGDSVLYEYDFGSTTELILKIHSCREGQKKNSEIVILSRNNPLKILCSNCKEREAKWVASEAYYGEKPFWCEQCLKARYYEEGEEECEEEEYEEEECEGEECEEEEYEENEYESILESYLPVCNSPRMGICGYEGSTRYPDQFEPDKEQGK